MAIQKSFVVKNGIEVNSNLIFGDIVTDRVGIGTTRPTDTLQVHGGIAGTSINVSGVGTIPTLRGSTLNYATGNIVTGVITSISGNTINYATGNIVAGVITSISGSTLNYDTGNIVSGVITSISGSTINYSGIVTGGSYRVGSTEVISSARELKNIVSLDATTAATIESVIANGPNTFADLTVTGISTLNTVGISSNLNVTGVTTLNSTRISTNLNVSGITTLGTVSISSGIVSATSGIVTYYGDGKYLQNILSGVGVATAGGTVGTGATILDFRGPGISTVTVSAGIATINIVGGGGGGAVSIGTTAPPAPTNGDLWYSPDYGRTFVWYDEVALGIGSTAVWVDAAPFNLQVSELDEMGVTNLTVTQSTTLNRVNVSGISTFTNSAGAIKIGVGTTALLVEGNARITGILTVGTGSITLDGSNDQITIGAGLTINSSGISVNNFSGTGINVSGVVTATTFNGSGASLTNLNASNISSGTLSNARLPQSISVSGIVTANTFSGSGASLTTLNASNVSSGTLDNARLPQSISVSGIITATTFSGSGASLTTLNASNISSGTLNNDRLPQDISVSGIITAVDFNSTSDETLKYNVETVDNALDTVNSIRGVKFQWKEDDRVSYGVIAQELQQVLPELVSNGDIKTVNYNGIIGVLIEAVKELKAEIEDLKNNK